MLKQKKFIVAILAAMLVFGVALTAYMQWTSEPEAKPAAKKSLVAKQKQKKTRKIRKTTRVAANEETAEKIDSQKRIGPNFTFDEDEEAKLTEEQRKLLAAIRAAADDDDLKSLRDIVANMQAYGLDKVPAYIQNEAIEALGWFDKKTIPEMFGFLGSDSEDVRESAADEILDALDDSSLSDREISSMLVNMAKVLNDEDILDDAFASFMDMRNSVAVQTIKEISLTGTPTAQKLMADVIEDVTDKDDIRTFKQLDDWLQANPDDEDDGDLFDGDKDDDDDKTDDDDDDQG